MRMIANALLNFFRCLVYIFVPLGCILLGALFGVSAFLETTADQAGYIADEVGRLLPEAEHRVDELMGFLITNVRALDWSDPFAAVGTMLTTDWLSVLLADFFSLSEAAAADLTGRLSETMESVASAMTGAVASFAAFLVLGVLLGYFVTNWFVRKSTVRRGFWKFWLNAFIDGLLSATLVSFAVWLLGVWNPGTVITAAVGILVFGFVSLFEAYFLHGRGKIAFRKVVTVGNCFLLFASHFAILAIATFMVWLLELLTNPIVAIGVGAAVAIIALLVVKVNAESYVYEVANEREKGRLPAPKFGT